jgi:hypothetical protein
MDNTVSVLIRQNINGRAYFNLFIINFQCTLYVNLIAQHVSVYSGT